MSEWPSIPITAPKRDRSYVGEVLRPDFDQAVVIEQWYRETLVPQLACVVDGTAFPALPSATWMSNGKDVVLVKSGEVVVGAWVLDDGQLLYPCAILDDIAGIFRALWDTTIKNFDYVWGSTGNPVIMEFAKKAVRVPPSPNSPTINGERIEWRKPGGKP